MLDAGADGKVGGLHSNVLCAQSKGGLFDHQMVEAVRSRQTYWVPSGTVIDGIALIQRAGGIASLAPHQPPPHMPIVAVYAFHFRLIKGSQAQPDIFI